MFSSNVVLEELVRRSLKGLVLHESFFETSWVAGGKMSVLKDFRRLQVYSYIQNGLILKAFAFVYTTVSKNVASVFEISAVNLMVGWCEFACAMNLFISGLLTSHNEKMSSMYRFQIIGFMTLLLRICLKIGHKDICKGNGHFSTHGGTVNL